MTLRKSRLGRWTHRHQRFHRFVHATWCRTIGPFDKKRVGTTGGPPPIVCPTGQHWDPVLKICVNDTPPICPAGQHWDPVAKACIPDIIPPITYDVFVNGVKGMNFLTVLSAQLWISNNLPSPAYPGPGTWKIQQSDGVVYSTGTYLAVVPKEFSVLVLDSASGLPIANAQCSYAGFFNSTSANGMALMSLLLPTGSLTVTASGHTKFFQQITPAVGSTFTVRLVSTSGIQYLTFTVHVIDIATLPIAGASITVTGIPPPGGAQTTFTGTMGNATFTVVAIPSVPLTINVAKMGYAPNTVVLTPVNGRTYDIVLS